MTLVDLEKRKIALVEELGVQFEKEKRLAPVAARIFAHLILNCNGISFEELVEIVEASKSTVFTHLDHMQTAGLVAYFTKPGDRKRYFIPSPDRLIQSIDETLEMWKRSKAMHEKIINYKTEVNEYRKDEPEKQFKLGFERNYQTFLDEAMTVFNKLKNNIKQTAEQ